MPRRLLPILAGIVVLLVGGIVHGYWTLRWYASPALASAAERLKDVPTSFGNWDAAPLQIPEEQLIQAGAVAWKLQRYSSSTSDADINTLLLVGRPGAMTIHQPQHCYPGAGFEMKGLPVRCPIKSPSGDVLGEFWTARFERQTPTGPSLLRIFWGWNASGRWRAPDNPRWELASEPAIYKLYVIREATRRNDHKELDQEPSYAFLQELLPRLTPSLLPAASP